MVRLRPMNACPYTSFCDLYFDEYRVILVSLIPCTQNCKYQNEGLCTLSQAQSVHQAIPNDVCLNFTPRLSNQHSDGLSDIADPDQV